MVSARELTPYYDPLLGVVFDLDGTLILSRHDFSRMRREVIRVAQQCGVPPGHLSVTEPVPKLMERAREELERAPGAPGIVYRFEAEVDRALDGIEMEALPRTVPRTGARALLKALTDSDFRLGILTRSSERFSRAALQATGLGQFFPYLRTRSAPGPAKPSPESLEILLKEMGVPRDRAALVGDGLVDYECARGAHVRFVAILADPSEPNATTPERFQAAGVRVVVPGLPELARTLGVRAAPAAPAG